MKGVFFDALIDSLKVFPITFVVYVLIEWIESRRSMKTRARLLSSGFAPLFGAAAGVIPQCGVSVIAAKLYQGGLIYLGTLIAVFFSTSDEALPLLVSHAASNPELWGKFATLIGIKVAYAVFCGFIINFVHSKLMKKQLSWGGLAKEESVSSQVDGSNCGCECGECQTTSKFTQFFVRPLLHSLKIVLYIFIVNFLLGALINVVIGQDAFYAFLSKSIYLQPLLSAIVGLIPNCASSIVITELYTGGVLCLGGALSGLTINSGLGIAVLLSDKSKIRQSVFVIVLMFCLSLLLGYAALLIF